VLDAATNKGVKNATVQCKRLGDTLSFFTQTDAVGYFEMNDLPQGYYRLQISAVGYVAKQIDSIHLRPERFDFNLNDLLLYTKVNKESDVTVYAEKPLIEQKDGKLIFNTGESALAANSTTSDLLKNTPLVTVDGDGKVLLKGKEVKILVDDKPVEVNAKQLQELLESMPGSFVEKIEVMTNPPPQYANERGGVINIVTKKGKVGATLRGNTYYGTRGEAGVGLNASYRKKKWSLQLNAGFNTNTFRGDGSSQRQNFYTDSSNGLNTANEYVNRNWRPSLRLNADHEFNKQNNLNFTVQWNGNHTRNHSETEYVNINRWGNAWRISDRTVDQQGEGRGLNLSSAYTVKNKKQTSVLRIIGTANFGNQHNDRDFYQQFFWGDKTPMGIDSTQRQNNESQNRNYSLRVNYDKPVDSNRFFISTGFNLFSNNSDNEVNTAFMKKPERIFLKNDLLSTALGFRQRIAAARAALRYRIITDFHITGGVQAEHTTTWLQLAGQSNDFKNSYLSWLPFANINRKFNEDYSFTFSYKKSIQRPGGNELNPAVDYSDPYNTRFGNPYLQPSFAHNLDWMFSRSGTKFSWNTSVGYNRLDDIYAQVRTLLPDGKTQVTWQNISARQEYEASAWGGYTYAKNSRMNLSVGYSYNVYSNFDKQTFRYRNGGSLTSSFTGNYAKSDLLQFTWAFTLNRFANPQGTVRTNLSTNLGVQRKFIEKRLVITVNIIDPFTEQRNRTITTGRNFTLDSRSFTQTRNIKLGVSWNFIKPPKPKVKQKTGKK
jgi:hypothetical protein